jgi:hypothetical protein
MSVLTIYNCGTAFDRNSNDIIADLARRTGGTEGRDWIINAGPGSPELADDTPLGIGGLDQLTGVGMYPAAIRSLQVAARQRPRVVNMAGWSRGSITSLMIARYVNQVCGATCNLFLFDPVVGDPVLNGWLHHDAPINSIGAHVNAITVVQQLDATDFIFQAHDPFDGNGNHARSSRVLQMPGSHGAAVYRSDPNYASAYEIGRMLVQDFLAGYGTVLQGFQAASTRDYLEHYSNLWLSVSNGFAYVPSEAPWSNREEATRFGNGMIVRVVFNHHHISMLNAHAPRNALALMYALSARRRPARNILDEATREFERMPANLPKTRAYLSRVRGWLNIYNP